MTSGGSRSFERGVADITERYQNNPRQNHPGDSFVPFLDFKLKRPQIGGWLATQSTPPDPPLHDCHISKGLVSHFGRKTTQFVSK